VNQRTSRVIKLLVLGLTLSFVATILVVKVSFTSETLDALRNMDRLVFLYCLGLVVTAWVCNGLRLRLLSAALGFRIPLARCVRITLSSEFGIAATPSGVGGGFLKIYLTRRQGVPVGQAMSFLATDMTLDFIFMLIIIPLGISSFLQIFRPIVKRPTEGVLYLLAATALVVLFAALFWRRRVTANGPRAPSAGLQRPRGLRGLRVSARLMLRKWSGEFRTGYTTLLSLKKHYLVGTFFVSLVQWSCRYGVLVVILRALGVTDVNPFALFLLQGMLFFGGLLLVLPGGGGGVETAFAFTVGQLVPASIVGVALVLWRFFTYYLYLAAGGTMLLVTAGKGAFSESLEPISDDSPPAS
jgi:uncharacterized protein (TIRG00374 family)